jgi:hypothetical protein
LALVVNFEPKDPWFKSQAAQKTKKKSFFFSKMTHFHYRNFYKNDEVRFEYPPKFFNEVRLCKNVTKKSDAQVGRVVTCHMLRID